MKYIPTLNLGVITSFMKWIGLQGKKIHNSADKLCYAYRPQLASSLDNWQTRDSIVNITSKSPDGFSLLTDTFSSRQNMRPPIYTLHLWKSFLLFHSYDPKLVYLFDCAWAVDGELYNGVELFAPWFVYS